MHNSKIEPGGYPFGRTRKVNGLMRQRNFPSAGGLAVGILVLVISILVQPGDPNSVTVRDLLITFSAVFTGANAVGLLELRRRQETPDVVNEEPI